MKPNEILGMVEEAAGTRMYETKRVAALKTIEKKQAKVDELNAVLSEEITPTLERLRGEKQNYLKWSKNSADIERIERFVIAAEFGKALLALENNSEGSAEMEQKVAELEAQASQYQEEIAKKEEEIEARSSQLKGEFDENHKEAKANEEKRSKELVKITSSWQNSKEVVSKAESDLEAATTFADETKSAVVTQDKKISDESNTIEERNQAATNAEEHLAQLTSDYQNMSAGIASSQGDEGRTLPQQISMAHSDSKTAEAKAKQAKMKISHLSKELKVRKRLRNRFDYCHAMLYNI
jgi:structural maintenance of chromosome 2